MENMILSGIIKEYKNKPLEKVGECEFKYGWFDPSSCERGWVLIQKDSEEKWYYKVNFLHIRRLWLLYILCMVTAFLLLYKVVFCGIIDIL